MMSNEKTSRFFDRYAHDFSAIYGSRRSPAHSLINRLFRESMKLRFFMTLEGCSPVEGKSIIDIGCGPGHYAVALARRGAARVLGLDFADGMLEVARENAERAGVADRCEFLKADFLTHEFDEKFDYSVVMGFMDYIAEPRGVVEKVIELTRERAYFSFPMRGGILAWQRKLRYRARCALYLYEPEDALQLFEGLECNRVDAEIIDRDVFIAAQVA